MDRTGFKQVETCVKINPIKRVTSYGRHKRRSSCIQSRLYDTTASAVYPLGEKYVVKLRKDYIFIEDIESKKFIVLSFQKWKRLCDLIIEIDESVNDVMEKKNNVALK
jgi:hypothetical protein